MHTHMHAHTHTQHDPIGDLLSSKFPDIPRKPLLSVEHVSMDAEGLRRLVVSCEWFVCRLVASDKWQVAIVGGKLFFLVKVISWNMGHSCAV